MLLAVLSPVFNFDSVQVCLAVRVVCVRVEASLRDPSHGVVSPGGGLKAKGILSWRVQGKRVLTQGFRGPGDRGW